MQQKGIAQIHFIVLLIIVIVMVGVGFWWWQTRSASTLGSQIYQEVQNPQTNPFTKINPFKGVYQNPFE